MPNNEENNNGKKPLGYILLVFRAEGVIDRKRYNRPTYGSEIGALVVGGEDNEDQTLTSRDIVVLYQIVVEDLVESLS